MTDNLTAQSIDTERLARSILDKTRDARTEEDVKMRMEPLLRHAFTQAGVDVNIVEYEKTTAITAKRMDAVYGTLILEYKAPGLLERKISREQAQSQLQRYLTEEAQRLGIQSEAFLEKAVGVALDGRNILFIRFTRTPRMLATPVPIETEQPDLFPETKATQGFHIQGPYPISASSLAALLIYVRAAARRPLTAENLASVFSPKCEVTRLLVSELYAAAMRGQRRSAFPRVAAFYDEWDRIFGVIYGEQLDKTETAVAETAVLYGLPTDVRLKPLLFAIHTFYAFLMKLMAIELIALQKEFKTTSFVSGLAAAEEAVVRERLSYLESGADFADRGIINFLEADFFSWYLDAWSPRLAGAIRGVVRALGEFEPATPILEPEWTRDLLQNLYELVVPQRLRHGLGEYYTPNWLAEHLIDKTGYDGAPGTRFLDPACGSGTFLVKAIQRAVRHAEGRPRVHIAETARAILDGIVGFDLNPLAVLAARTNYLIAFAQFLPHVRPVSLPVYLCDSVLPPDGNKEAQQSLFDNNVAVFSTREHKYVFPISMVNKERIDAFTSLVMVGLRGKMKGEEFHRLLSSRMELPSGDLDRLDAIYRTIKELDDQKRDGIWAHYIKNAFAPVYVGQFDFVVGNPPWIRWGYLADEYRRRTLALWHRYGLFSLKGHATRLGGGEKDFSMLFTYACADRYLKDGGTLGFVITQEVFKSKGAGEGFRRFRLGESGAHLKIVGMEDMVQLQPFHAANKTTIFTLKKGAHTTYPVPVIDWKRKIGIGRIPPETLLQDVLEMTERRRLQAIPVDPAKPVSSWQTAGKDELKMSQVLKGANPYSARLGARVEPYGVFWLNLKEVRPDGLLVIENQYDRGKRVIKSVHDSIEPDLVYPAVSGGDITKFGIKDHFFVLISQDPSKRQGFDEDWMMTTIPHTYAYLTQFKNILIKRAAYQKYFYREIKKQGQLTRREPFAPFYSMYNINNETFARHRVTWKRMASRMEAVVLSTLKTPFCAKPVISTDTTSFIAAKSDDEAHYLCALLNSNVVNEFIRSFSSGGRGFGAPSVVSNLAIPVFGSAKHLHRQLAELSQQAHHDVERKKDIGDLEKNINARAGELWNIKS